MHPPQRPGRSRDLCPRVLLPFGFAPYRPADPDPHRAKQIPSVPITLLEDFQDSIGLQIFPILCQHRLVDVRIEWIQVRGQDFGESLSFEKSPKHVESLEETCGYLFDRVFTIVQCTCPVEVVQDR